jgi:hypothetical protein
LGGRGQVRQGCHCHRGSPYPCHSQPNLKPRCELHVCQKKCLASLLGLFNANGKLAIVPQSSDFDYHERNFGWTQKSWCEWGRLYNFLTLKGPF